MDANYESIGGAHRWNDGRAYGKAAPTPDEVLVRCGRGTPGGELLRRYWQPVARSEEATLYPKLVKLLGEELILFRDRSITGYQGCRKSTAGVLPGSHGRSMQWPSTP